MKITGIEIKQYAKPLDPPFLASWDPNPRVKFASTIVYVYTDEGITGIGSGDLMTGFAGHEKFFIGKDPFELAVILGNIIDNAIEAARQTEVKWLSLQITADKGILFIRVSNSYCGCIKTSGNKLLTSKEDKETPGLGLDSVKDILKKHNADMKITCDKNISTVDILLYLTVKRG